MKGLSLALPTSPGSHDPKTGLLEKDEVTTLAAQAMKQSGNAVVSMVHFEGLKKHAKEADSEKHEALLKKISSHLQALSLEGQTASQVGDGEFAILHDKKNTPEQIMEMITKISGVKNFKPKVSYIEGDNVELSEKEIIKAVSYTLDKLSEQKGDVSFTTLGAYEKAYDETQEFLS